MRYVALLRGINVGGNNRVPMAELRACFEAAGMRNVSTYINSGNVLFKSDEPDPAKLVQLCERAIEERFGFPVRVAIVSKAELADALGHAPPWWGKDLETSRHNALFVIAPASSEAVMAAVGEPKPEYERVASHGSVIFWSVSIRNIGRTRWSRIVGTSAYKDVTIRNANTTRKLFELMQ